MNIFKRILIVIGIIMTLITNVKFLINGDIHEFDYIWNE